MVEFLSWVCIAVVATLTVVGLLGVLSTGLMLGIRRLSATPSEAHSPVDSRRTGATFG